MGRTAKTANEQLDLLKGRGMVITNIDKAKEVLLDVGYYRLGFYWFPFEKTYPSKHNREHVFVEGSNFDDAVKLYYFDFNLRNILLKPLSRIEVAFRTKVVYIISNYYKDSPTWFVDNEVVNKKQSATFYDKVYKQILATQAPIALHHKHHINDKYAPAWKTLEFMTLGEVLHLFNSLKDESLKTQIANQFGIKKVVTFANYMNLIKDLRNTCAHGNVLYDFTPEKSLRKGPAMMKGIGLNQNLNGALRIVLYMMNQISSNRYNELVDDIDSLIEKYSQQDAVKKILKEISGLDELHIR